MQKNNHKQISSSSFLMDKRSKEWKASIAWFLASGELKKFSKHSHNKELLMTEDDISESSLYTHKIEVEKKISQIKDPLWRRICVDIFRVLGPLAFKNLWAAKFKAVSPKGKKAYLMCPNQDVAETIERYHFVVLDELKKFYPFLSSIETEIISPHIKHEHNFSSFYRSIDK